MTSMSARIDPETLAAWIREMSASLRENPTQFAFDIQIIGTKIEGGSGGPALIASAMGGMPGSTAIGFQAGAPQIGALQIRQAHVAGREQQIGGWNEVLEAIAAALEHGKEQSVLRGYLERLREQSFPALVLGLLTNALSAAVGL